MSGFGRVVTFLGLLGLALATSPAAGSERSASMVIDANTGKVLHNQSGDALRHPASLTKMMTIYLAFEAIEAGRTSFKTSIPVSERAAAQAPSKLGAKAGTEITLGHAIRALIVKSANDMAVAVAEHLGGSEAEFARLMTRRARALGMSDTVFRNASGLPDPEQVTTARDMLTLAMRLADDFPDHYQMFSITSFNWGGKTFRTHNSLLKRFPGIDGIKTGYTRSSGFNLVSSYRADGKHVVAAVFGGVSAGARDAYMRMLLFQSLEKAAPERSRPTAKQLVAMAQPAVRPAKKPIAASDKKPTKLAASPTPVPKPSAKAPRPSPNGSEAAPAEATGMAMKSEDRPTDPVPGATATTDAPQDAPAFTIAKVRTISVLPPADGPVASIETGAGQSAVTSRDPAGEGPKFNFAALRQTLAAASDQASSDSETGPSDTATKPQVTDDRPQFAIASTGATPRAATARAEVEQAPDATLPVRAAETVVTKSSAPVAEQSVARPPSTFAEQVALLESGASRLGGPQPSEDVETARASGVHQIQIGAYRTEGEAQSAFKKALQRAADALAGSQPVVVPVPAGNTTLYRARFAGFDLNGATSACLELRRQSIDCFVSAAR